MFRVSGLEINRNVRENLLILQSDIFYGVVESFAITFRHLSLKLFFHIHCTLS